MVGKKSVNKNIGCGENKMEDNCCFVL